MPTGTLKTNLDQAALADAASAPPKIAGTGNVADSHPAPRIIYIRDSTNVVWAITVSTSGTLAATKV
jgi:hypothetical protein